MKRTSVTAIAAMIAKTSSTVRKDGLLVGRLSLIEGFLDGLSVSVIVMISYQSSGIECRPEDVPRRRAGLPLRRSR